MLGRHQEQHPVKRGRSLPFIIFRTMLSLTMLSILIFAIYTALKEFSGVDPVKADPKLMLLSVVTSEEAEKIINTLFGVELPKEIPFVGSIIPSIAVIQPDQPNNLATTKIEAPLFHFAVVADSHNDNKNLEKALIQARYRGAKFVIGLGDYTEVGSVEELQAAKSIFDASGIPYYLTIGDHDMWASRNERKLSTTFYNQVFGTAYQSFGDSGVRFILINNADNYLGIDSLQWKWLEEELQTNRQSYLQVFAFMQEPIYHPSSDHIMGKVNKNVSDQATSLVQLFDAAEIGEVFAGDAHFHTRYIEPTTGLKMTVAGAVVAERNAQQPRFLLVDVYSDGSYNIEDVEIE